MGCCDGTVPRGRRLLVLIAVFTTNFLCQGINLCSGIWYVEWLEYFQAGDVTTSWVGSTCLAFGCISAPLASLVTNRLGFRVAVMGGGVIMTVGLAGAAYSPNIYFLMALYGCLTGVGVGMVYTPVSLVLIWYFEKNPGLALGVSALGVGLGSTLMPLIVESLKGHYGWRGAMLLVSGLNLNICVCGAIFRPLGNMKKCTGNDNLKKNAHLELFKEVNFLTHLGHQFLFSLGMSAMIVQLVNVAERNTGVRGYESTLVMVVYGASSMLGRVVQGVISHARIVTTLTQYSVSYLIIGFTFFVMPVTDVYGLFLAFTGVLGFCSAPWGMLIQLVVKEIVGQERLVTAYGHSRFLAGFGWGVGPPIASWVAEMTRTPSAVLYVAGGSVILSILITIKIWHEACTAKLSFTIPPDGEMGKNRDVAACDKKLKITTDEDKCMLEGGSGL